MELAAALDRSVQEEVRGHDVVAVAFSGGLDSSVLVNCAKKRSKVVACTAAARGSRDFGTVAEAASRIGVELEMTELTDTRVRDELAAMKLPFEPSMMDASLWCLYSTVAKSARGAGARVILLGQLADELFGGYARYKAALADGGEAAAAGAMKGDIEGYGARGRTRDVDACSRWVRPAFPFGHEEVVQMGLAMPVSFKVSSSETKIVLRRAARVLGVPEPLVVAPKKAAQYSSGIQKMVARTSLFNGRASAEHHDSIASAEGEAGGVQASPGKVQLLRPG